MSRSLNHIGFIVDGNRRWARARGLPTLEGHRRGFKKVEMAIDELQDTEVKYVSFFLFSTENWGRSAEEVSYLMNLAKNTINDLGKKAQRGNYRIVILGRHEPVEPKLWQRMQELEAETSQNTGLTVCICFNYGGLWEITDAANSAIAAGAELQSPEELRRFIYHPEVPDCDLIVRTSGEERISGFQLWRAAYAEFLFLEKHFPDLEKADILACIENYHQRQRRFGK